MSTSTATVAIIDGRKWEAARAEATRRVECF